MDGVSNGGAEEKEVQMRGREKWYEEERMKRGGGGLMNRRFSLRPHM